MTSTGPFGRIAAAMCAAVLLAGCAGRSTDGGSTASVAASSGETAAPPPTEGTGAESPQPRNAGGPVIEIASLPIGGDAGDPSRIERCVDVSWAGPASIPDGVSVSITRVALSRADTFRIGGAGCSGPNQRWCHASPTFTSLPGSARCVVAVTQISNDDSLDATLILSGRIHCDTSAACQQLQVEDLPGSQITLRATPGLVPDGSSPSDGSRAPSDPADSHRASSPTPTSEPITSPTTDSS